MPEDRVGLVEKGQACTAQFYAFPGETIPGTVRSLAPTISKERRTLRVFFQLDDPRGRLKPGMFAEIGLGTDVRKTLRIPADGVLHVGQSDYVLVGTKSGEWKVTQVKTGEQYGSRIEILEGLQPGDRVIGCRGHSLEALCRAGRAAASGRGAAVRATDGRHGRFRRGAAADDSHADSLCAAPTLAGADVGRHARRPGGPAFQQQQIDAYPDISGQMVQIITTYPGRAAEEVEQQVTIPLEIAMRSVPRVEKIRSRTIFGLSIVEVLFEEGVENYWARQRVKEKLDEATLPDGVKPDLGPLATAYGEIYRYELVSDGTHDLMDLRTLQDWVVTPRMLRCRGSGRRGELRRLPEAIHGDLQSGPVGALQPLAGRRHRRHPEQQLQRRRQRRLAGEHVVRDSRQGLRAGRGGDRRDLHQVGRRHARLFPRRGHRGPGLPAADGHFQQGPPRRIDRGHRAHAPRREPLGGARPVKEAVKELNATFLPKGVEVRTFYDRTFLVENTLHTVAHSVMLGITLVVLVLLLFLGRPSMAALVALTIPFALMVALLLMYVTGIPIGLLSVGAIDFGIIVDGAVIMAENIAHRLGGAARERTRQNVNKTVLAAALEVERPVFFSVLMIIGAYLPLLSLTSIEGLLFRPMALTLVFALLGALFFALFVVPVLATFLFRHGYQEWENPFLRWFRPDLCGHSPRAPAQSAGWWRWPWPACWRWSSCGSCRDWAPNSSPIWMKA